MIQIFTDNAGNLPEELLRQHQIGRVFLTYTVNGEPVPPDAPFDGQAFYGAMRAGAQVQTSMLNPQAVRDAFARCLQAGDDVLYVGMSSGISGSMPAATVTAAELAEEYPERNIAVVDTKGASLGEGLPVLEAVRLRESGVPFHELAVRVQVLCGQMCQYFYVDDLQYLRRTGRVSGAVALAANLLNIKALLRGDELGRIVQCGRARGRSGAIRALAEKYAGLARDRALPAGIAHADNEAGARELEALLREAGQTGEILTVCYEPVTGSHVGPGAVALFFYGDHR